MNVSAQSEIKEKELQEEVTTLQKKIADLTKSIESGNETLSKVMKSQDKIVTEYIRISEKFQNQIADIYVIVLNRLKTTTSTVDDNYKQFHEELIESLKKIVDSTPFCIIQNNGVFIKNSSPNSRFKTHESPISQTKENNVESSTSKSPKIDNNNNNRMFITKNTEDEGEHSIDFSKISDETEVVSTVAFRKKEKIIKQKKSLEKTKVSVDFFNQELQFKHVFSSHKEFVKLMSEYESKMRKENSKGLFITMAEKELLDCESTMLLFVKNNKFWKEHHEHFKNKLQRPFNSTCNKMSEEYIINRDKKEKIELKNQSIILSSQSTIASSKKKTKTSKQNDNVEDEIELEEKEIKYFSGINSMCKIDPKTKKQYFVRPIALFVMQFLLYEQNILLMQEEAEKIRDLAKINESIETNMLNFDFFAEDWDKLIKN
jgi:hypothetical protein